MSYVSTVLAKGPAMLLPLTETSGTSLADASGNNIVGTAQGGALLNTWDGALPAGLPGAVKLDGTNDYISLPDGGSWFTPATNGFSVEAWVYIRTAATWARLFDFANAFNTGDIWATFWSGSGPTLFSVNASDSYASAPNNPTTGAWHHFIFTCTAAGARTIFMDGAQWYTGTGSAPVNRARANMFFGRSQYSDPYLSVSIAAPAVYNKPLTLADAQSNYAAGTEPNEVPGTPVITSTKALPTRAYLKWGATIGVGGTTPSYEYRIDGGAPTNVGNVLKTLVTGLTNGQTYTFEVRGVNAVGPGPWSAPVTVTPDASVLFYDDFDRPASTTSPGTPVLGTGYASDTYVASGSVWGITANGQLYEVTGAERNLLAQGADAYDIDIEFTVAAASAGALSDINIFLRRNTAATTGFINVSTYQSNLALSYRDATTFRGLGVAPNVTWANGDRMRIIASGKSLYVLRNGKVLVSGEDTFSQPTHTAWGVRLTRGDQYVDELTAKTPVAGQFDKTVGLAQYSYAPSALAAGFVYKGRDTKIADTGSVA